MKTLATALLALLSVLVPLSAIAQQGNIGSCAVGGERQDSNLRGAAEWPKVVCAENVLFSAGKDAAVPDAERSDF
jgi:hypothetical protein